MREFMVWWRIPSNRDEWTLAVDTVNSREAEAVWEALGNVFMSLGMVNYQLHCTRGDEKPPAIRLDAGFHARKASHEQ